jgi:hypothetical protein
VRLKWCENRENCVSLFCMMLFEILLKIGTKPEQKQIHRNTRKQATSMLISKQTIKTDQQTNKQMQTYIQTNKIATVCAKKQ